MFILYFTFLSPLPLHISLLCTHAHTHTHTHTHVCVCEHFAQEYEDTIQSLKSQVQLLEQRRALVQYEMEQRDLIAVTSVYGGPTELHSAPSIVSSIAL